MSKLQILLIITVCFIACGSARPTASDSGTRHISQHDRTSSVRRHADIKLSTELAKLLRLNKRFEALRKLMASAELGNVSLEIMPHKDLIPDHRETSERLLSTLNGEHKDDNLRVRVVGHRPNFVPHHMDEFIRKADALRQAALTARTCLDLQNTLLKLPSARIRVRCETDVPRRLSSVASDSSVPVGLRSYVPTGRLHLNGHWRLNGLNRRHARSRRRRV